MGVLLERLQAVIATGVWGQRPVEIIVCDNGSEDASRDIARSHGVRLVECPVRGYGAALRFGILAAHQPIIVMLDADLTYDPAEAPKLVGRLTVETDMVLGDRLHRPKFHRAMPVLHRYFGTPILTAMINRLYASRGGRIEDCNCGYRCFWRDAFIEWRPVSDGMEIASEMLAWISHTGLD